jgi:hypothetical protein
VHNPDGVALSLSDMALGGSLFLTGDATCRKPAVEGRIDMSAARIAGQMIGMYLGWAQVSPSVNLTGAQTTTLADDPDTWPAAFLIRGFTYERFGPLTSTSRPNWEAGPTDRLAGKAKLVRDRPVRARGAGVPRARSPGGGRGGADQPTQARAPRGDAAGGRGPADPAVGAHGPDVQPLRLRLPARPRWLAVYTPTGRLFTVSPVGPAEPGALPDRVGDYSTNTRARPGPDSCGPTHGVCTPLLHVRSTAR